MSTAKDECTIPCSYLYLILFVNTYNVFAHRGFWCLEFNNKLNQSNVEAGDASFEID